MSFRVTRAGELIGREAAQARAPLGIVDLSLAPTPAMATGWPRFWKRSASRRRRARLDRRARPAQRRGEEGRRDGSAMSIGGLSGAFIPLSEDAGMIRGGKERELHHHRQARSDDRGLLGRP